MAISREELLRIINRIPDEKIPFIRDLLIHIYEEEHINSDEAKEIDAAKKRIADGDYATFEEVFGDLDV